jgi:ERG8-type phosphomevalonate kinase
MAVVARAPGKLYIAGEYAVVEPGRPAVLVAVDRYVTVTVTPTEGTGHIISDQTAPRALAWHRVGDDLVVDPEQSPSRFVLAAIQTVEEVARSLGAPLGVYDLRIDSELDDDSGRKFGLGSSAAVTVATVRALCAFHRLDLTRMEQFKLALLATLAVERSGSGGDVAASQFGGWIRYTAFDRERVRAERVARPAVELLREPWPGSVWPGSSRPTGCAFWWAGRDRRRRPPGSWTASRPASATATCATWRSSTTARRAWMPWWPRWRPTTRVACAAPSAATASCCAGSASTPASRSRHPRSPG